MTTLEAMAKAAYEEYYRGKIHPGLIDPWDQISDEIKNQWQWTVCAGFGEFKWELSNLIQRIDHIRGLCPKKRPD